MKSISELYPDEKCECGKPVTHLLGEKHVCGKCYASAADNALRRPEPQYYIGQPPKLVSFEVYRRNS